MQRGKKITYINFVYCVNVVCVNCSLQMWDIRDGMCKQTFTGHESDINAITVRLHVDDNNNSNIVIIMITIIHLCLCHNVIMSSIVPRGS